MGYLASFLSLPVPVGFEAGVDVVMLVGQLKSVLVVNVTSKATIGILLMLPGLLTQAHGVAVLVAMAGISVLVALPLFFRDCLSSSAGLCCASLSLPYSVSRFWASSRWVLCRTAFLRWCYPTSLVGRLWSAAPGIGLISFTETVAVARTFCLPISANKELLAVGVANI